VNNKSLSLLNTTPRMLQLLSSRTRKSLSYLSPGAGAFLVKGFHLLAECATVTSVQETFNLYLKEKLMTKPMYVTLALVAVVSITAVAFVQQGQYLLGLAGSPLLFGLLAVLVRQQRVAERRTARQ
jgi:hypothetical protein